MRWLPTISFSSRHDRREQHHGRQPGKHRRSSHEDISASCGCRSFVHCTDVSGIKCPALSPALSFNEAHGARPLPQPLPLPQQPHRRYSSSPELDSRFSSPLASPPLVSRMPSSNVYAYQEERNFAQPVDVYSSRIMRHDRGGIGGSPDNFNAGVPPRSTAASPLTSPVRSPPRSVNYSPAHECSSRHSSSARSPNRHPNSGVTSPIHRNMSSESLTSLHENIDHANVHPLPLPPVATLPSPSTSTAQVMTRLDSLPMKSQWQKGKLIGRGTFGSVYVGTNRENGSLCAMKEVEIFPEDPKSAESIRQLQQEIKVLSQLEHPNIVQYYGSEIKDDKFYIYLEYVHPGSINKYVRENFGAVTESVVRNFSRHILKGLAYLHSKKTIHRDIKGANLLVDSSGVVKLADFGMAKLLTGQRADLSLRGSPYWMAPELMQAVMQKDNSTDVAFAVDIWSLGCTIIEMLTGKPPWSEYEGAAAMFKVMRNTPPIPNTLSSEGKDFLTRCFCRDPAARPSATALLDHQFLRS